MSTLSIKNLNNCHNIENNKSTNILPFNDIIQQKTFKSSPFSFIRKKCFRKKIK